VRDVWGTRQHKGAAPKWGREVENSMSRADKLPSRLRILIWIALLIPSHGTAQAQFQVVHSFGAPGDGVGLLDSVAVDAQGNLYGTNAQGGTYNLGTVFELSPDGDGNWTETILYSFGTSGPQDGNSPGGPVTIGSEGVLYGVTSAGGTHNFGTAYSLTAGPGGWSETILHNFIRQEADGLLNNVVLDATGNLFGSAGRFELSPGSSGWTFSHTCNLVRVCAGNNYANTALGPGDRLFAAGNSDGKYHVGDVYAVVPTPNGWQVGDLYDFGAYPTDGQIPGFGPLVADRAGNIYGVTSQGGSHVCGEGGCGTIYRLSRQPNGTWQETILYNFQIISAGTGFNPIGGVILDRVGNLYGTTGYGGPCGCGVVYRLSHNKNDTWTYTVLHTFMYTDGTLPYSALTFDSHGNLFGTTLGGGQYGVGVVFEISRATDGTN